MAGIASWVFAVCLLAPGEVARGDSVVVSVTVEGFRSDGGSCRLLLFDSEEGFPDSQAEAVAALSEMIRGGEVVFRFRVRPGRYAIAILHDENSNGKMDKTWYGKPTEGFGASRNPKIGLGPPGFDESALMLDEQLNHSRIMLNYL
jgi:uncharacterized protein (DUF2141 family)